VPFLIKDLVCQTKGDPYHCGVEFLGARPDALCDPEFAPRKSGRPRHGRRAGHQSTPDRCNSARSPVTAPDRL
jgi:hypothetical protein